MKNFPKLGNDFFPKNQSTKMSFDLFGNTVFHNCCMLLPWPRREYMLDKFENTNSLKVFEKIFYKSLDEKYCTFFVVLREQGLDGFYKRNTMGKTAHDYLIAIYESAMTDLPLIKEKYPLFLKAAEHFLDLTSRMLNVFETLQSNVLIPILMKRKIDRVVLFNILRQSFHFSEKRIAEIVISVFKK